MKNQQGAPEALRPIQRFNNIFGLMNPEARGLYVRYEDHVAALVEAQQPTTHVQNPAEIEHVAGDVSKNGAESDMAQQPAPSAAADLIAALEEARRAINSMKVEAETAGQGDEQMMLEACETISNEGLQADMAIRAALASAPQPSPTPQADSQPAPEYVGNGMFKGETIQKAAEHWANWCDVRCMTGLSEFLRVVAARAPADSVLEDAALWFAERDNVLHSFWVLLGEAEVHADNNNNPLLKHQVEEFYRQWNALNGTTLGPRWVSRAARKKGGRDAG